MLFGNDLRAAMPWLETIKADLGRESHKRNLIDALRLTLTSLLIVAAAALLVTMQVLHVTRFNGSSITETSTQGLRGATREPAGRHH